MFEVKAGIHNCTISINGRRMSCPLLHLDHRSDYRVGLTCIIGDKTVELRRNKLCARCPLTRGQGREIPNGKK